MLALLIIAMLIGTCVCLALVVHYNRRTVAAHEQIRLAQAREQLARRRIEVAAMRLALATRDRNRA